MLNVLSFAVIMLFNTATERISSNDILGMWTDQKQTFTVSMTYNNGEYHGYFQWIKHQNPIYGQPMRDVKNPDPGLKSREIIGMKFLEGFSYDGDRKFKGGTIYDFESGHTYKAYIEILEKGVAKVRGYIGIPLLGRSEIVYKQN